jgi:hypothetical protein
MEGRIGDSALSQLVHLIFATCMPWFRKDFAAPDGYSCNWFAVVSQRARHVVAKHMPMQLLVAAEFSANALLSLCNTFVKVSNCICHEILRDVLARAHL